MSGAAVRIAAIAGLCAVAVGCSASPSHPPAPTTTSVNSSVNASVGAPVSASASAGVAAVQGYLQSVNTLCDALLPKVLAVIHGGHPGVYPVGEFFAELPAHSKLRSDFDAQLATIRVPEAAKPQAAAMANYIRFANDLDARRLAAARQGQAAFDKETLADNATAPNDPSIAARTAAGFNESCNAR